MEARLLVRIISVLAVLLGIAAAVLFACREGLCTSRVRDTSTIRTFQQCVQAGYPVLLSTPRRCVLTDGRIFAEASSSSVAAVEHSAAGDGIAVFFMDTRQDPDKARCDAPVGVSRRMATAEDVPLQALQALLRGPTSQEAARGLLTQIPVSVSILSLSVTDGVAHADMSKELQAGVSGACRVQSIRAQVERTLLQFKNIRSVAISVEGGTAGVLQP